MPLARLDLRGVPADELAARLPAPPAGHCFPTEAVAAILDQVRKGGDAALVELTERFDGVAPASLRVPASELTGALDAVDAELRRALELAFERISAYHA